MLVPSDIFVWIGGALFCQLTLCTHLLIRILSTVQVIKTKQALISQHVKFTYQEKEEEYL